MRLHCGYSTNMNSAASTVRYSAPVDAAEAALRFRVLELRGDRVLIELLDSGMFIAPAEVVALSEVEAA